MLISCLILLRVLIKGALQHHTYDDFSEHIRGIILIDIGLSLN